jgi:hypothetical protein
MGKRPKTGGKDFQKGQEPGPGRPALPDWLRSVRALSKDTVARLLGLCWETPLDQLVAISQNPMTPAGLMIVANIFIRAAIQGDLDCTKFIMDRSIGKVPDKIEQSTTIQVLPTFEEARQKLLNDYATQPPAIDVVAEEL